MASMNRIRKPEIAPNQSSRHTAPLPVDSSVNAVSIRRQMFRKSVLRADSVSQDDSIK